MNIGKLNGISFGKLYASNRAVKNEIRKLDPRIQQYVKTAVKGLDKFDYYDIAIENGKISMIEKDMNYPIIEKKPLNDKYNIVDVLIYAYQKEFYDHVTSIIRSGKNIMKNNGEGDIIANIYDKARTAGTLCELNKFVKNN